jgi:hypothetical protein
MLRIASSILLLTFVLMIPGRSQVKQTPVTPRKEAPPEFVGDGCTWFPDGDYADCCLAHDRDYYRGGTKEERKASDKRLAQCVRSKGHKYISRLMFLGVRVGGVAWLHTPFSWGFGQRRRETRK